MNTEEIMENSMEIETIVEVAPDTIILQNIAADIRIMMVLALLTFFMSCVRAWRKNTIRG